MTTDALSGLAGAAASGLSGTSGTTSTSATDQNELSRDTFLKLMLAQMKDQDPMKPQDPSAFLSQLAQFSTVSGIQGMASDISTLTSALRSSQILGGTTLVGHDVLSVASDATLGATGSVTGAVTIPEGASGAGIAITDASGQLVRQLPLSSQEGVTGFTWDGTTDLGTRAAAGTYTFKAIANVGGAAQTLETQLTSRVGSVTIDPTNYSLTLNTDLGPIPLANVRRVM